MSAILLEPINRPIGTSIADMTLYGATPQAIAQYRPAADPSLLQEHGTPSAGTSDGVTTIASAPAAAPVTSSFWADHPITGFAGAMPAFHPIHLPPIELHAPSEAAVPTGAIQASLLSGGAASLVAQAETPQHLASELPADTGTLTPLDLLPPVALPIADAVLDVGNGVVSGVLGLLDQGLSAHSLDMANDLAHGVATLTPPIADLAAATLDLHGDSAGVGEAAVLVATLAPPVEPLSAPIAPQIDAVGEDLAGATAAAADLIAAPLDGVAAPASLLTGVAGTELDDTPLGGADPAAGVHTLVGLVATSDMFQLGDAGAALAPDDSGASMLDALAADATLAPPLLGDLDHHDDLASGATDLHHGIL